MSFSLKQTREKLGLTQVEFAILVGAAPISITRWEHGTTPALAVERICVCIDRIGFFPKTTDLKSMLREQGGQHTLEYLLSFKKGGLG